MIERYALYDIDQLRDQFQLPGGVPRGVKQRFNYVPAQRVPVVLLRDGSVVMELMQWGFVSQGSRDTNSIFRYKTFNVRTDDIFNKNMWEKSVRTQRCLVPANGFYAFSQTRDGKVPYYIHSPSTPILALAGVYSSWTDSEGRESGMVSIVTAPASEDMYRYTAYLPVVVSPDDQPTWLDPSVDSHGTLHEIMHTPSFTPLSVSRVRDDIFSKKLDKPELIRPV